MKEKALSASIPKKKFTGVLWELLRILKGNKYNKIINLTNF